MLLAIIAIVLIVWLGNRAAAVISFVTVVVALTISYQGTAAARKQAAEAAEQVRQSAAQVVAAREQTRLAALATAYAYHPVLLPLHDAAPPVGESARKYFPAISEFQPPVPERASRVFLVGQRDGSASVYIRNVGAGPAIAVDVSLTDASGHERVLEGHPAIAPGADERFTARLGMRHERPRCSSTDVASWVEQVADRLSPGLLTDQQAMSQVYGLRIRYNGVAPASSTVELHAVFDPRGTGRWCTISDTNSLPTT